MLYHDVQSEEGQQEFAEVVRDIESRGLMYPVTTVDGAFVYDGAVSYPAIMRAVHNKLVERDGTAAV